jgi:hypothetical protein
MFWGIVLKAGASHTLPEGSDLLHVSQACLADAKEGKNMLQVTDNNVTYTLAVLEKDKSDMASLDLFFNTAAPPTFINKGKSEIHITGYFEMANGMESEDESMDDEEIESEIEEEEEEINSAAEAKKAIAGISKKAAKALEESEDEEEGVIEEESEDDDEDEEDDEDDEEDEDEEDEEDDEDDEEDDDEDEEDDDEDEDEEEEEEEEAVVPTKANNKRPAPAQTKQQPAEKVQKTENSADSFAKAISTFLKANGGKQTVSAIGGKVSRPQGVPKLKQFCVTRKEFKVTGDLVELA